MEKYYTLISFGDGVIHFQPDDERNTLCGADGGIAHVHLQLPGQMSYSPFEVGVLVLCGGLDLTRGCARCADIVEAIEDLEDDLVDM